MPGQNATPAKAARRSRPLRLEADAEDIGRGLGRLVMALLEIVRQLLERQAIRRADAGDLDPDQIERLGQALLALEERFAELRDAFGVDEREPLLPVGVEDLLVDAEREEERHDHGNEPGRNQPRTAAERIG